MAATTGGNISQRVCKTNEDRIDLRMSSKQVGPVPNMLTYKIMEVLGAQLWTLDRSVSLHKSLAEGHKHPASCRRLRSAGVRLACVSLRLQRGDDPVLVVEQLP